MHDSSKIDVEDMSRMWAIIIHINIVQMMTSLRLSRPFMTVQSAIKSWRRAWEYEAHEGREGEGEGGKGRGEGRRGRGEGILQVFCSLRSHCKIILLHHNPVSNSLCLRWKRFSSSIPTQAREPVPTTRPLR